RDQQQAEDPGRNFPAGRGRWIEHRRPLFRKALLRAAADHRSSTSWEDQWSDRPRRTVRAASGFTTLEAVVGRRPTGDRRGRGLARPVTFPFRCAGLHGIGNAWKAERRWLAESRAAA